ncbi:MAG TPA: hypothetical protein VGM10_22175, partial [Actinocrinis sp.]
MQTQLIWRALTAADTAAAAEVCAAAEAVDDEGESFDAEDILEDLTAASVDPERGALAAVTADGRMAAFALIYARTAA